LQGWSVIKNEVKWVAVSHRGETQRGGGGGGGGGGVLTAPGHGYVEKGKRK